MSFVSCSDDSVGLLTLFQKNALTFIKSFQGIVEAYVSSFFVEDHWNKLPKQWQNVLSVMNTEELSGLLSSTSCPRRVLPLGLLCLKKCTETYSLNRRPIDSDSHEIQQTFRKDTSDQVCKVPVSVQLEKPDAGRSKDNIKDGQYLPLNHCFRKHVKPKKQHEILQLGKLINLVCHTCGSNHVVDVGAGQGHLSRLLTFGHGRKVTTVEASGCHAPKAEKYDRDMSYTIRSQLKRKLKESKEDVGCNVESNSVESLKLPDHVTCLIQPNTTPSEFLSVIQSQTRNNYEDEVECQCHREVSDNSIKPQNTSEQICDKCLQQGKVSHEDDRLLLTGLHACGDLTPTILRVFSRCHNIRGVVSVGCCYMKMSANDTSEGTEEAGYPMSTFVKGLPDHGLSYEAREMACHSLDVYRQRLLDNPPNLKLHCYRAMLQEIVLHNKPDFVFGAKKLTIKKADQMEFEKYAKIGLDKLGLDPSIDEDLLKTVECKLFRWKDVVAFYTIRLALAPVVETVILIDRMLYLKEQGISSYLIPVFDPNLSPRNFALVAYK